MTGEQDGSLDDGDVVLFYGEGVNTRYTDAGVYWLSHDGALGKRMTEQPSTAGGSLVATHTHSVHSEENRIYLSALPKESGFRPLVWASHRCIARLPPFQDIETMSWILSMLRREIIRHQWKQLLVGHVDGVHHLRLYVNGNEVHDDTWSGRTVYQGGAQFSQSLSTRRKQYGSHRIGK